MTRGTMRTELRVAADDRLSQTWTDAELDTALNRGMRRVARQIARYQGRYNYANGSVTITTDGTNKTFATSQPSYYQFWKVTRTDTPTSEPVHIIDEREEADWASGSGFDRYGYMVVFLSVNTSGDTTLRFPLVPAANLTFLVEFSVRPSEIATGGGTDSSTYTLIQEDYHELIVYEAAVYLGAGNKDKNVENIRIRDELRIDMVHGLGDANRSGVIHNRMGWGQYG